MGDRRPGDGAGRQLGVVLLGFIVAACTAPEQAPGGSGVKPGGNAPAAGAPGAAPPGGVSATAPWLRLTVNVIGLEGDRLAVYGPEGEQRLRVAPGALGSAAAGAGDTVDLECEVDATGLRTIRAVRPHTGLGIRYGTVTAVDGGGITLDGPLGAQTFLVNQWSDMPAGLHAGEYVTVKHYRTDAGAAVLNTRRFPGRLMEEGVIAGVTPQGFALRSLGGLRAFPLPAAGQLPPVGASARVSYARDAADAVIGLTIEPGPDPLVFIGKMSGQNATAHTFSMVDAWTMTLGTVEFSLPGGVPEGIVPGDLVEASWRWDGGPLPTIVAMQERTLSPVFFGRITAIDEAHVAMVTLQRQPKRLRRDADTWLPVPIKVGDMADVVWRVDPAGGDPVAELIVKE